MNFFKICALYQLLVGLLNQEVLKWDRHIARTWGKINTTKIWAQKF